MFSRSQKNKRCCAKCTCEECTCGSKPEEPEEPVDPEDDDDQDETPPANRGGSIANPLFGIDIADHQAGLDIAKVADLGYTFTFAKATEGPYRDGSSFTNALYKKQLGAIKANGVVPVPTTS